MALVKPIKLLPDGNFGEFGAGDIVDAPSTEVDLITLVNGETVDMPAGSAVYKTGTGNICLLARADSQAASRVIGFAKTLIAANVSGYIQTDGIVGGFTGLTIGARYFLSPITAGAITTTCPTAAGQIVAPVGTAISATELEISIQPTIQR